MIPAIKESIKLGFFTGFQSVLIKSITALIRLGLAALCCRNLLPPEFNFFMFFLGLVSVIPFLDLGIGGAFFRRKILYLEMESKQDLAKEWFFFSFARLLLLGFFLGSIFSLSIFLVFRKFQVLAIFLLFLRLPFSLPVEYFFAKSKMILVYSLEIIEQGLLLLAIYFGSQSLSMKELQLLYSTILFSMTLVVFFAFLKSKKWSLKLLFIDSFVHKEEMFFSLHTILSGSYLVFVPFIINFFRDPYDTYEFNIAYRLVSVGLGASMVFFNPVWNKMLARYHEKKFSNHRSYLFFLVWIALIGLLGWHMIYDKFFYLISGFTPTSTNLSFYLSIWSLTIFFFIGLDQILKTYSIKISLLFWVLLYFGTFFSFLE
jgi:hypothetical protein